MSARMAICVGLDTDMVDCNLCEASEESGTAVDNGWRQIRDYDIDFCPDCAADRDEINVYITQKNINALQEYADKDHGLHDNNINEFMDELGIGAG